MRRLINDAYDIDVIKDERLIIGVIRMEYTGRGRNTLILITPLGNFECPGFSTISELRLK